jgi:hypothetical protein
MEMHYVIHGGLSDDSLLPTELELPEPQTHRPEPEPFFQRTSGEHLKEAKKALAEAYKPNKDPMKTTWGRVSDAQRHLKAIKAGSKEYKEAQQLMNEVLIRMKGMEKVSSILARRLMMRQREMLAYEFEFFYLAKGLDARIALSGPDKSHLRMECSPLSEASILKMVQDTDLLLYLERADFKKVTLGDGENFSWTHTF